MYTNLSWGNENARRRVVSITALLALLLSFFSMGALPSVRADDGAAVGELPGSLFMRIPSTGT